MRRALLILALAACSAPAPVSDRGTTEAVAVPSRARPPTPEVELRWGAGAPRDGALWRRGRSLARDPIDACVRAKTAAFERVDLGCTALARRLGATDVVDGVCTCDRFGCETVVHATCTDNVLEETATFGAGASPLRAVAHALAVARAEGRCLRRLDAVRELAVTCVRGDALHGCVATARCAGSGRMRREEGTR